jgi:hypothetical protein
VVREVAGGWQVSGVARLQSGAYYNIQSTSPIALGTVRADYNPAARIYNDHAGVCGYVNNGTGINPAGTPAGITCNDSTKPFFATPVSAGPRFGNSPYGAIHGPGLAQTDATLSKFFPITELVRVKFQADAFNILNRTNFNGLNLNASNSNFGTISSAFPPRQLQLGLKVMF